MTDHASTREAMKTEEETRRTAGMRISYLPGPIERDARVTLHAH
jgi:hypothetical protein